MQQFSSPVADLLCLQDNEVNLERDSFISTPSDGDIYEPLWDGQTGESNQNSIQPPPPPQQQQQQPDLAPPIPRRTVSSGAGLSNSTRMRTHPLVLNQPPLPPSGMLPPSYTESQSNSNNPASPSYPAGRGPVSNNNVTGSGQNGGDLPPTGAQIGALASMHGSSFSSVDSTSPSYYPGSQLDGATAAAPSHFALPGGGGDGAGGQSGNAVGMGAVPPSPTGALSSKMMEAMGLLGGLEDDPVCGWNAPPVNDHGAPPPYMPRSASNRGPQVSLKERQVEALKKEMEHAGGVKVVLRKLDCYHTIAWVECFGGVWIAGWNQKARPFLHNAFHVGDQIISINGQVIEGARMAQKLLKHSDDSAKITFIIRRVPNARIYLLKRSEDGESLGIRREGGTGEILELEPFGVTANHGVPVRAPTHDRQGLCNWFITEVNMRPVSLYFKGDEMEKRLNAVGKEISILIQPGDFINEIKQLMKKNFKNYKDYVVK